ncbi:unnamed protein product [Clavelina lepadiformis]|uniref:Headcase protein n=1 Tax=Clavelina lepadiformis TaxID=159417 RepID=A0ABP0EUU8_CLALP
MAGKRNRKDSDRSAGSGCSSGVPPGDDSPCGGACSSSSSGSVGSDSGDTLMRTCCFPMGCPFGEDAEAPEHLMVKVICTYDACPTSQFMHSECFTHWEDGLLSYLRSHGRARSWSDKQRRQNLWTKKGYDLAYRACVCKCKHGHLRKDLDWNPQSPSGASEQDLNNKKKNRKKHKDLPSLGSGVGLNGNFNRTKSKPIPNSKDARMRHSSTSSTPSVDQGYLSASPNTTEMGPAVFSPPSTQRSVFPFHNFPQSRTSNGLHLPSTSPLLEIPDDGSSPQSQLSPTSMDPPFTSPLSGFTPPTSPDEGLVQKPMERRNNQLSDVYENEIRRLFPSAGDVPSHPASDIQAMTTLIDNLRRRTRSTPGHSPYNETFASDQYVTNGMAQLNLCPDAPNTPYSEPHPLTYSMSFPPSAPRNAMTAFGNQGNQNLSSLGNGMTSSYADIINQEQRNAQLMLALRQKEQREIEKRELNKYILSMMTSEENKPQVIKIPHENGRQRSHTEIRLVPMRSTAFSKRYDFSLFEGVLSRSHVNPYHIKMEGEGYGSDDLRNFILASLSKAKCSQMNCVMCGVDLPVYDHFPLVDGTMFLSTERNERSTRNCFKIKVDSKCEYVHAVCMRCLEGLHNIVCRLCNTRWEGLHHQLGTLYMYDIFAASPCCQHRLCCKHCGGVIVNIRRGLTYFSDYSSQKTCPHCSARDYHFVRPVSTFQLMGLVFS